MEVETVKAGKNRIADVNGNRKGKHETIVVHRRISRRCKSESSATRRS